MHKDSNLRKRNALVIPGGLLAFYGVLGMLYAAVRTPSDTCPDSGDLIWLAGACRSAILVMAIPVILGLAMVAVGALAYRNRAHCRDGHGSWTHFGLALLISAVLLPALAMLLVPSVLGPDATIVRGTVEYPVSTVLAGLTGVALLMFIPFAVLYAAQARANPCCREKGCFTPCFCDEPAADEPVEPPVEQAPPEAPLDAGVPPPPPEPAPLPPPAPAEAAPAADLAWESVPDEPADEWKVLPDEEPAKEEPKADESPKRASLAGKAARPAPPLATRPADPAAPPADAMALAAKWAEEDEEALHELEADQAGKARKPSKAPKKKTSKAVSGKPAVKAVATPPVKKPAAKKPAKKGKK